MIFRCVSEMSEREYLENIGKYKDVRPVHKLFGDDLTDDINWIHAHKSMIVGAACELIWDMYYEEFIDKMILSKYRFYELIKKELNVEMKVIRTSQDSVKNCFIEQ